VYKKIVVKLRWHIYILRFVNIEILEDHYVKLMILSKFYSYSYLSTHTNLAGGRDPCLEDTDQQLTRFFPTKPTS
jgi:hypothetical protein